ncbi:MAG: MBL fold metallo-hydrolase [Verrucomicrobia bacterium]|nr:MBL fold metallo-hydrolase [Verrucomicrobiota bacterium]
MNPAGLGLWSIRVYRALVGRSGQQPKRVSGRIRDRWQSFLTLGHFDHAGNAKTLSDHWGVPIYAHPQETPYLAGRSSYPPLTQR